MCLSEARERAFFFPLKKNIPCSLILLSLIIHQSNHFPHGSFYKGLCWQGICSGWEAAKGCKSTDKHHRRKRERRNPCPVSQKWVSITKGKKGTETFRKELVSLMQSHHILEKDLEIIAFLSSFQSKASTPPLLSTPSSLKYNQQLQFKSPQC